MTSLYDLYNLEPLRAAQELDSVVETISNTFEAEIKHPLMYNQTPIRCKIHSKTHPDFTLLLVGISLIKGNEVMALEIGLIKMWMD